MPTVLNQNYLPKRGTSSYDIAVKR